MKHLLPLPDNHWPIEIDDLRGSFAGQLNIYRVMAHHPALLKARVPLRKHVVEGGSLTVREKEIVILRVAAHWQSAYEQSHHVVRGRKAGLTGQEIDEAQRGPTAWSGFESERVLLSNVDRLLCGQPHLVHIAAGEQAAQNILDLMALVGFYTTLAFIANTFEVPLDALP